MRSLDPYLPWILARDLDAVTSLEEKRGGNVRLDSASTLLKENIALLNLVDIKPGNGLFTWNNRRCGEAAISERLDRFMVSSFWMGDRWVTSSEILDGRGSDHWPIKLTIALPRQGINQSFKFQLMWLRDDSLHDLVLGWWSFGKLSHGTAMYSFSK